MEPDEAMRPQPAIAAVSQPSADYENGGNLSTLKPCDPF